jgi:hypothetical protein
MSVIKIKTIFFAFLILFTVLIVGCNPVEEYGDILIDSYMGSKKAVEQVNLKNMQRAIQMYRVTNGEYPKTLKDIEGIMDSPIDFELYQYNPENGEIKLIPQNSR